ncbi:hypothetical protein P3T27_004570 [Kitasatospora sp. MAA19]|uniref:hypothetical protein n=1 Tax=Kitasatospora sp. MAA19 TaxID=3035090 RepID=UPI0024768420|nr:hypothetical protein [Kitasatospora sp. MAA19]MDH6707833.1 hypothetical protein [Kitasatospora sp. MAA19]
MSQTTDLQGLAQANRAKAERAADAVEVAARLAGLPNVSVLPMASERGALVQLRMNLPQAEAFAKHVAAHAWCSGRLLRGELTGPMLDQLAELGLPDRVEVPEHVRKLLAS